MKEPIHRKIERSLIRILNKHEGVVGTGFLLSTGCAITCAHVVEGCGTGPDETIDIQFNHGGKVTKARIIREYWRGSESDDIAILNFETYLDAFPEGVEILSLGKAENCEGDKVVIMGFAELREGYSLRPAPGLVEGIVPNKNKESMIQLDANAFEGMSGSPVFNLSTGRVIGMFTEYLRTREIRWATTSETIQKFYPDVELNLPESLEEYISYLPEFSSGEHATGLGLYENARRLDDVFVKPKGKLLKHAGEIGDGNKEPELDIADFFKSNDEKHAMLIGGPGLGKTSLMRLLASSAWKQYSTWGFGSRYIPVYIPLKSLVALDGDFDQRLVTILSFQLGKRSKLPKDTLEQWQKKSGDNFLFLLDGLDEIPLTDRRDFYSWLYRLAKNNAEHKIIITSRKIDGLRKDFKGDVFQFFELQEFNKDQASDLIIKWLLFDGTELLSQLNALKVSGIYNTPLLITLAIIIFLEGHELPAHRSRLFEKYLDYVFDETRHAAFFENMSNDQKNIIRDCLAFMSLESVFAKKVLRIDDVEAIASNFIEKTTKKSKNEARQEGRRLVKLLSEHSGICYKQGNYFHYIHSKVEEHLASMALKTMIEDDHESFWTVYLEPNLIDTEKGNVFATTIAIMDHPSIYIEDVLSKTQSGRFSVYGLMLCTKAIAEGAVVNEDLYKKVVYSLADELSRPWESWESGAITSRHIWNVLEALPNNDRHFALQNYIFNNNKLCDTARIASAIRLQEHNWLIKFVSSKEVRTLDDVGTVNTAVLGLFSLGKFTEIKGVIDDDEQSANVRVYAASLLCDKYFQIGDRYYLVENRHLSDENPLARREDRYFDSVCATLEDLVLTGNDYSHSSERAIEILTYAGQSARLFSIVSQKATNAYYEFLTDIRGALLAGLGTLRASDELIKIANNDKFNFAYRIGAANLLEALGYHAEAANTVFSLASDVTIKEQQRTDFVYLLGDLQQADLLFKLAIKFGEWDGNCQPGDSLRKSKRNSISTVAINEIGELSKAEDYIEKIARDTSLHPLHRFNAIQVLGEIGKSSIAADLFLGLITESVISVEMKLDILSELNIMLRSDLVYEACSLVIESKSLSADEKLIFTKKMLAVEPNYELLLNLSKEESLTKATLNDIVRILVEDNLIGLVSQLLSIHKNSISIQKSILDYLLDSENAAINIYEICLNAEIDDVALMWLGNSLINYGDRAQAQMIYLLLMENASELHYQIKAAKKLVNTEYEDAVYEHINAAYEKEKDGFIYELDFAQTFLLLGDTEKAQNISNEILKSEYQIVEDKLSALEILQDIGAEGVSLEDLDLTGLASCSVEAQLHTARLLGKFGSKNAAKRLIKKILLSNPDSLLEAVSIYRDIDLIKDARALVSKAPIKIVAKNPEVYFEELYYLFRKKMVVKFVLALFENKKLDNQDSIFIIASKMLKEFDDPLPLFRVIKNNLDNYIQNQIILFAIQYDEKTLQRYQGEYTDIAKRFLEFMSSNLSAQELGDVFTRVLPYVPYSLGKLEKHNELVDIIKNKDVLYSIYTFAFDAFRASPNGVEACNVLLEFFEDEDSTYERKASTFISFHKIKVDALTTIHGISASLDDDEKNTIGERLFCLLEKTSWRMHNECVQLLPSFVTTSSSQWVEAFTKHLLLLARGSSPSTDYEFPEFMPPSEFSEMKKTADPRLRRHKSYRSEPDEQAEISITSLGKMDKTKYLEEIALNQECSDANRLFAVETLWSIEKNDTAAKLCFDLLQDNSLDPLVRKTAIKVLNYRGFQLPDEFAG